MRRRHWATSWSNFCNPPHPYEGRSIFAPGQRRRGAVAESDPDRLLRNAELALAAAKTRGGGMRAGLCARSGSAGARRCRGAGSRSAPGAGHGQIEIFYQPIMRLADDSVAGFEALLRWRHPSKGLIAPADFIAHSEETRIDRGRWAVSRWSARRSDLSALAALFSACRRRCLPASIFPAANCAIRASRNC